ncbi:MAG: hypothetical protein KGV58_00805 [Campylobacteraceae bacterium]|nr:hypothetical protein [Campylobacteraceae bacterium]MBS9778829.1 hypothetical protein [Campylobacteraceae bacterium]
MKKILLVSLLLLTNLQAGFFTSMFGSMAANALSSDKAQHRSASYEDKINSYLWNMYENKSFSKDWRFYADQLSNSNDIGRLDTVAQVYNSNGDKDKALEIYETKILPYLKFEKSSIRYKYEDYYNKIRGESNEIDYDKKFIIRIMSTC